jgi:hypothetical protein
MTEVSRKRCVGPEPDKEQRTAGRKTEDSGFEKLEANVKKAL